MELTEKEIKDKLQILNKEKKQLDDELFYMKYSNLTFLQIWRKYTNWKTIIIVTIVISLIVLLLMDYKIAILYLLAVPLLSLLTSWSNTLEISQKLKEIKKRKNE